MVRDYVRACDRCQKANPSNRPPPATLHPIAVHDIFHRWGIDIVGPLKETPSGMNYIIVATEYLTRWAEVKAIPDRSAPTVHKFLLGLVYRFGACRILVHDEGRKFVKKLVEELCEKVGIDDVKASAYHSQTNG